MALALSTLRVSPSISVSLLSTLIDTGVLSSSVVVAVSGVAGALEGRTAESEARLKKEVVERKRLHNLVQVRSQPMAHVVHMTW